MSPLRPAPPTAANIADFSLSRLEHFELFRGVPFKSYNVDDPDPVQCDLKVYQDHLVYQFINANLRKGSRLLEVGGGDSRILKHFSRDYECWNVDKCEGLGNGPVAFTSPHFKIVYDYIGTANPALPSGYFDLVFSISALEHTPEEQSLREGIARDLQRVVKPGAPNLHLFDCVWRPDGKSWVNGLIPHLYRTMPMKTRFASPEGLENDPGVYFMAETPFNAWWAPLVGSQYREFGRPFSMNLFWDAPGL
jgi:hypothetical protein